MTAVISAAMCAAVWLGGLALWAHQGPPVLQAAAEGPPLGRVAPVPPPAEGAVRVAVFNMSLSRNGPGMAWRAVAEGKDDRALNALEIVRRVRPDILAVMELDFDEEGLALQALQARLRQDSTESAGIDYPHVFADPVNTGVPTGLDLDGDGGTASPSDAQGWGRFPGQYGMAVLSRFPLDATALRSFRTLIWADMPGALIPEGTAPEAAAVQRLSSKSHWDLPALLPDGRALHLLVSHPTPPVFDGPEDRNGRRNHDEIRFWTDYVSGADWMRDDAGGAGGLDPAARFVVLGDLNADPQDGDGLHEGIGGLLSSPRVQDPAPASDGAAAWAEVQGGFNEGHSGDPRLDTADWRDGRGGPGNLRVDYALPDAGWEVTGAGVFWPGPDAPGAGLIASGRGKGSSDHRLVWVDIR